MSNPTNDEYTAFEAWLRKRWGGSDRGELTRQSNGAGYVNGNVDFAFAAYRADRATTPAPTEAAAMAHPEHARLLAEQVLAMDMVTDRGLKARELARAVLGDGHESPAELALRSLASWLGVGGYNSLTIDAKVMENRIRDGISAERSSEAAAMAATVPAVDPDGEAFRTAARLGLTLRMHGGCAQSGAPGSPSAYEVVGGQDPAAAMREAIARAEAVIANGGESQRLQAPVAGQPAEPSPATKTDLHQKLASVTTVVEQLLEALRYEMFMPCEQYDDARAKNLMNIGVEAGEKWLAAPKGDSNG